VSSFREQVARLQPAIRRERQQMADKELHEANALAAVEAQDIVLATKMKVLGREVVSILREHRVPSLPEVRKMNDGRHPGLQKRWTESTGRRAWIVFHHVYEHTSDSYEAQYGGVFSDGEYFDTGFNRPAKHFDKVVYEQNPKKQKVTHERLERQ
jgi:hypothetical protein